MLLGRPAEITEPLEERRQMRRFELRLPATVAFANSGPQDVLTETQNVSARGVFFYLEGKIAEGSPVEVTLTFPPHVTLAGNVRVRFTAHVIRVEAVPGSTRIGVAAAIEEYEFLRAYGADASSDGVGWGTE
jgi:hypothetical protein